ncbi:hypothetical protein [Herbaspirillum sp. NPDC101397]|uniref:hypothetical protein n=1 Tax=Herbaspirillum sp. NPDC101397 TaxID=3364006 RepID=UPI00383A5F88
MFLDPHESPIAALVRHINAWKKRDRLSNEAIADLIVAAHERIGGPARTGIRFDPGSADEYNRMKANSARIWRWLDDVTEDKNLLSANFVHSVVAALPLDLKISYWNEVLGLDGFCVASVEAGEGEFRIHDLAVLMKEDGEAHQACARVLEDPSAESLHLAQKEIAEAIETKRRAGRLIGAMLRARSLIGRLCHPRRAKEHA